ncbi:MAG: N-6 DNA methylase, partial [Ignavibacteriales bacterium]|nr:N-6 DNA methylase [Ignavibacteriales bacterium]
QATVDDIAEVLAAANVKKILHDYFEEGRGTDPIFHFYETFLASYNPEERERRGVYYTPEPVVSYIVRSLNTILKEKFGRGDGFATQSVTVLDPAGGTLTFLAEAAKLAVEEFVSKYGDGSRRKFIEDHVLKHFYAFELMMAPYAAGHLKMGYLLEELGHKLSGDERFQFYLTNTLEMEELAQTSLPGMSSLSEESHLAGQLKKKQPILVILGNPPYSGHSVNKGAWIPELIKTYKKIDGEPLGEKNPKWLQDDYVKFIRFAQWKIEQIGEGTIGFITNHSYLDNPTFRGMRQSLMNSFDEIYLLDLHGNSLKKEKTPDGSKDENVFDIQQGVAIGLFVKKKKHKGEKKIFHADLWGLREQKYKKLTTVNFKTVKWKQLKPSSPFYLFVPRDEKRSLRYQAYPSIPEIFPVNSVGIVTARDHLSIQWTRHDIWTTVNNFAWLDTEIARAAYHLGQDVRDWKVELAQNDLKKSGPEKENVVPILYRPFDIRYTYYTGRSKGFHCMPRGEVMQHMLKDNIGLITVRKAPPDSLFNYFFVSENIISNGSIRSDNQSIDTFFPLYIYPERKKSRSGSGIPLMLFEPEVPYGTGKRVPNIATKIIEMLTLTYKRQLSPEDIFYYIYAVLYSNAYRQKYAEFLKTDFPRVPFSSSYKLFKSLAEKGDELVAIHLLKSKKLAKPIAHCEGEGENRVEKVIYDEKKKCVYFNPSQYFADVAKEVWEYHIGGYQVAQKWLKDRKERVLSSEEVSHYCKVVTALAETIKIQETLDLLFKDVEKNTI